jgi:predicted MPP superfamily phosphohydrolase
LLVGAYSALAHWVLRPLHARGLGQGVTGFLDGLEYLLQQPGRVAAAAVGLRSFHHITAAVWVFSFAINLIFYFALGFLLRFMIRGKQTRGRPAGSVCLRRRRFLRRGLGVAGGAGSLGFGYSLAVEPRWVEVTHHVFDLRGLPPPLIGLRAAQLTDIHHGPWLSQAYVRRVIDLVNDVAPDLVFLTGDYVHQSSRYIPAVVRELARLRPRVGTLAVLGNHEWLEDVALTRRELAGAGLLLIDNDRVILTPDRKLGRAGTAGLCIAGVGDLWEDTPDYQQALGGIPETMPRLLLSHNPDVAEEPALEASGLRVDLMVSGHTHGGQIRIPGLGTPILPSRYGQKYAQGVVEGPVCPVYVCRGIGMSVLPLRIGVRPELAVLEFRAGGLVPAALPEHRQAPSPSRP